jgi:hypothetical protein
VERLSEVSMSLVVIQEGTRRFTRDGKLQRWEMYGGKDAQVGEIVYRPESDVREWNITRAENPRDAEDFVRGESGSFISDLFQGRGYGAMTHEGDVVRFAPDRCMIHRECRANPVLGRGCLMNTWDEKWKARGSK